MKALVAKNRAELDQAHSAIQVFIGSRMEDLDIEIAEEEANYDQAKRHKWASRPFRARVLKLQHRRVFFEKVQAVLDAGYMIIPNLAGLDVFMIRTEEELPVGDATQFSYHGRPDLEQSAQLLSPGVGEYQHPLPHKTSYESTRERNGEEETVTEWYATNWKKEIGFPLDIANPVTLEVTSQAAALKLFDEIGVVRDWNRGRGDPIICGRICHPDKSTNATFFVAWHFDPSVWG